MLTQPISNKSQTSVINRLISNLLWTFWRTPTLPGLIVTKSAVQCLFLFLSQDQVLSKPVDRFFHIIVQTTHYSTRSTRMPQMCSRIGISQLNCNITKKVHRRFDKFLPLLRSQLSTKPNTDYLVVLPRIFYYYQFRHISNNEICKHGQSYLIQLPFSIL